MNRILQTSIITTTLIGAATISQAATTIVTVEGALGSGNGIYMDLQSQASGHINGGVTGIWSNWSNSWGFGNQGATTGDGGVNSGPGDTSDSDLAVFGRSADDKSYGSGSHEIQVDYTGLSQNTTYNLWAVIIQDMSGTKDPSHDLQWGLTSGSLTAVDSGIGSYDLSTKITGSDAANQLAGHLLGQITTDGSGAITIYYDRAGVADRRGSNGKRTQFDGVLFDVVPEPSTAALLGLGGLTLILRRRK